MRERGDSECMSSALRATPSQIAVSPVTNVLALNPGRK